MKKLWWIGMMIPISGMGQAIEGSTLSKWMDMHTLRRGSGNSVFYPLLLTHAGTEARRSYWLTAGNMHMIGGLQRMEAVMNSHAGNGAMGWVLSAGGGGPVDRAGLAGQYSQLLGSQVRMGLSLGGSMEKWRGHATVRRWSGVLKAIFRINELTAFSARLGWDGMMRGKSFRLRKMWVTEMGRAVNTGLLLSARVAQADDQDLEMEVMGDWQLNKSMALMGGINISTGSLMFGLHQSGKKSRKGGCINSHPMLGTGLEIFYAHDIQ